MGYIISFKKRTVFHLLIGAILIGLTGCSQGGKNTTRDEYVQNIDLVSGIWHSAKRMTPYSAELIINNDSTFHFSYGACLLSGFSKGQWILADSILILNSFPADSCLFLREFGDDCITADQLEEMKLKTTIEDCNPENTAEYVLFQEVKFQFIGDTLKHIFIGEKLCPEIRNDFFRP